MLRTEIKITKKGVVSRMWFEYGLPGTFHSEGANEFRPSYNHDTILAEVLTWLIGGLPRAEWDVEIIKADRNSSLQTLTKENLIKSIEYHQLPHSMCRGARANPDLYGYGDL